jgi:hypothetical protein
MLWQGRRGSSNVDDRRGISGGQAAVGGGIIGVIVLVINLLMGGSGGEMPQLPNLTGGQESRQLSPEEKAADDQRAEFVKVVLQETETVWNAIYKNMGSDYPEPTLVLFRDAVQSGCGNASSASGPFYCPADQQLYIDLSFYQDLQTKFNAPGDFAMAYVVAHEVGHHIQTINGTSEKVQRMRGQVSQAEYNKYSVMMELQADFLAGVWAHHARNLKYEDGRSIIEPDDFAEALNAANAIGDDRLTQGRVSTESFTHGTSAQRMYWFKKGFETGDIRQGDTFNSPDLR